MITHPHLETPRGTLDALTSDFLIDRTAELSDNKYQCGTIL